MKNFLIFILALLPFSQVCAWGRVGHDVTATIAEHHLTPTAAQKVDKILGGHSLVYYANWMDVASHTPEYAYSRTWHYLNIDANETLETKVRNPNGDVLSAVTEITEKLKKGGLSEKEEFDNLRMLIHLVGDVHCPMHMGRLSDLGGNQVPVTVFGNPTSLHSAWDSQIVEAAHKWGYSEWQNQIDRLSAEEVAQIQAGSPVDWVHETHDVCREVYEASPEGVDISYEYVARFTPVVEQQFLRGGYRLAKLLNEIYR